MRRLILTLLVATAALAPAATEARSVTQIPTGQQTGIEGDRMTAAFECIAAGDADALSVNITECYVRTTDGTRYDQAFTLRTAGPFAATGWLLVRVPMQPFQVCMRTEVIWIDASLQNLPEKCS
jgi:hypothetical protein